MIPYTIIDAEQRSDEWYAARLGRLTGSVASDMLATTKKGEIAAGYRKLLARLVLERLTNRSQESGFQSGAMLRGVELEPVAYEHYMVQTGRLLHRTGFLACNNLMAGVSLDGHEVDEDGRIVRIAEIKCPEDHTHLEYLETGKIPHDYRCQIRHALWITGADECDWFSFNPNFPESMQMALVTVQASEMDLDEYDAKARAFLKAVEDKHRSLLGWKAVA